MHFLNKDEIYSRHLSRPRAAAKAELQGAARRYKLVLCVPENEKDQCIFVVGPDESVCKLPDHVKVVSPDGKVVKPSRGKTFYVTLGSINPFHGVLEVGDGDL